MYYSNAIITIVIIDYYSEMVYKEKIYDIKLYYEKYILKRMLIIVFYMLKSIMILKGG